ncbi:MAG: DNA mismatch repair protein MutS [Thermomicrobiales bacterium]
MAMQQVRSPAINQFADELDACPDLLAFIDTAVDEDEDGTARIRPGFAAELDAAVSEAHETRAWLTDLERTERARTGIRSLKVGYNKVFGYYIEVTRPNLSLVPVDYTRKQTVATGERYVTTPLKEAEARLAAADEMIEALERAALARITARITDAAGRLVATAQALAFLDALLSLAEVAASRDWIAPALDESDALEIVGGRHPVVEATLAGEAFIPNDCRLGGAEPRLLLVTGPNMGGKSTYLRQVALIVLLAQTGSFVPAAAARIGLVDRIFTRVGAHDDLAGGASTFMVEMVETATILHHATRRGLVILDEVGRGTSTDDGLAIARAVVEDLHDRIGARTLFATHYLELTGLADALPDVANAHVAAIETEGRVIFLYAVRPGPADRSYGVQVARLAGLPPWVADRAASILASLPEDQPALSLQEPTANGYDVAASLNGPRQLALDGITLAPAPADRLARSLRDLDLDGLTPREAIDWLFEQRSRLP